VRVAEPPSSWRGKGLERQEPLCIPAFAFASEEERVELGIGAERDAHPQHGGVAAVSHHTDTHRCIKAE